MGNRHRIYADLESSAETIREYQPGTVPGLLQTPEYTWTRGSEGGRAPCLLQTPEYTWTLINRAMAKGPVSYVPERLAQARLQRQRTVLRPEGPHYEVILDEVGLRRYEAPPEVYVPQLRHIVAVAESEPRLSVRVFPLRTELTANLMPRSPLHIFTFTDADDPTVTVEETVTTDLILTQPEKNLPQPGAVSKRPWRCTIGSEQLELPQFARRDQ